MNAFAKELSGRSLEQMLDVGSQDGPRMAKISVTLGFYSLCASCVGDASFENLVHIRFGSLVRGTGFASSLVSLVHKYGNMKGTTACKGILRVRGGLQR